MRSPTGNNVAGRHGIEPRPQGFGVPHHAVRTTTLGALSRSRTHLGRGRSPLPNPLGHQRNFGGAGRNRTHLSRVRSAVPNPVEPLPRNDYRRRLLNLAAMVMGDMNEWGRSIQLSYGIRKVILGSLRVTGWTRTNDFPLRGLYHESR